MEAASGEGSIFYQASSFISIHENSSHQTMPGLEGRQGQRTGCSGCAGGRSIEAVELVRSWPTTSLERAPVFSLLFSLLKNSMI